MKDKAFKQAVAEKLDHFDSTFDAKGFWKNLNL